MAHWSQAGFWLAFRAGAGILRAMPFPVSAVSCSTDYAGPVTGGVPLACNFDTQGCDAGDIYLATLDTIGGTEFIQVALSDYVVTDEGGGVFTVTPDLSYAAGITVRVYRWLAYTQPFIFSETGPLPAGQIMAALNRIVQLEQQLRAEAGLDVAAITIPPVAALMLPQTVFTDAAARGNATPAFLGQLGTQLSTGGIYRGSSIAAGGWTLIPTGGGGGSYTAGNGLTLTGSEFTIDTAITLDLNSTQGPIQNKSFGDNKFDGIQCSNGLQALDFIPVASSVNYLDIIPAATGNRPGIRANGTDANVSLNLYTKGTGTVTINGVDAVTTTGTQTISSKTIITSTTTNPAETQQTLTDAASIAWNLNLGAIAKVTVAASRTMAAPSGLRDGSIATLSIIQGGAGTNLITWDAVFKWPGGAAPTLSTAAGKRDVFTFLVDGGNLYGQSSLGY